MALADAGTSAVDGLGLTGVQEEPLFYSEDEDAEEQGVQGGFGDENHEQWINDPFDQEPNALAAELYSHLETHMDWSGACLSRLSKMWEVHQQLLLKRVVLGKSRQRYKV